ncbi:MAG: hypothetical protein ABDI19_02175 [Armatimonadota bacterium]
MRTMQKRWLSRALRAFCALIIVTTALSQGTTQPFTFQGYLRQNNAPVDGNRQMRFRIYDAAAGGTLVWDSGNLTVGVSNGLFTVTLNTPASVWTGAPRFLEIQIDPPSGPTLNPRIPITPAPYAIRANTAGTANPIGAAGGDLSGTYPNPTVEKLRGRLVAATAPTTGQVLKWDGSQWAPAADLSDTLWAASGTNIYNTNTGNVGVGTATPGYLLDVRGNRNVRLMNIENANTGTAADGLHITVAGSYGWGLNSVATGANAMAVRGEATGANAWAGYFIGRGYFSGTVGIGTGISSADMTARLNVAANSITTNATLRLHETEADFARLEFTNTNTARKWHIAGFIGGAVNDDYLNLWNSQTGDIVSLRGDGSVAVGAPLLYTARLNVSADSTITNATLRLHEAANDVVRLEFTNTNTARKWHIAGYIGTGTDSNSDSIAFWNSGYPGHGGNIMRIRGDGTVEVRVLEITGADLAEKFPVTDKVEPGMVVEIDPDNPGNLRLARGAYNTRVAGVVAGANGLSKGIILGNLEGSESHVPVAISGRVWVYADATQHAIEPGMLLTTSDKPGYAMAVRDRDRAQGAILGKAMTRLEKGKTGMVLVLVNLQ